MSKLMATADRRVLLIVFDGLQPSQVNPRLMPNLNRFADEGVRFTRSHSVFPPVTRLNAASLVTGCYPGTHGIAANRFVFRDVDRSQPLDVMEPEMRRVNAATGGRACLRPSIGEILGRAGAEYVAVITGSTGNAFCHSPKTDPDSGIVVQPDYYVPGHLGEQITRRFGPWPPFVVPNLARLSRATDILLRYVIDERDPEVALIWYSEPDYTQHLHGLGSPLANEVLSKADLEFGRVLTHLESLGRRDSTDIIVTSDHGYSTSLGDIDVSEQVRGAGFPDANVPGGVAIASNSGSVLFYVRDADPQTTRRLAHWLFGEQWCGAVFASDRVGPIEGALSASQIGIDGPRGPDIAISMMWDSESNGAGYRGHVWSAGGMKAGLGDHGSASAHEMNNTLVAGGPSFKRKYVSELPSGNIDIAPTALYLLGFDVRRFDGRVLREALADSQTSNPSTRVQCVHEATYKGSSLTYRQTATVAFSGPKRGPVRSKTRGVPPAKRGACRSKTRGCLTAVAEAAFTA